MQKKKKEIWGQMLEDKVEKFQSCILWEKYSGVEMDSAALGGLSDSSHYLHVLI